MQTLNLEEVLERIVQRDGRYHREAYLFLREALEHTQRRALGQKKEARHVTAQELLDGIQQYALSQFGPMSKLVLNEWGIFACEDFGALVFNMIDEGLLSKTESDSPKDFERGFDFEEAFSRPFRPATRAATPMPPHTKAGPP